MKVINFSENYFYQLEKSLTLHIILGETSRDCDLNDINILNEKDRGNRQNRNRVFL
jgi:hypothetical protein